MPTQDTGLAPDSADLVTDPLTDKPITLEEFQARYDKDAQEFLLMGDVRHIRRVAAREASRRAALESAVALYLRGCLSADELAEALARSERAA